MVSMPCASTLCALTWSLILLVGHAQSRSRRLLRQARQDRFVNSLSLCHPACLLPTCSGKGSFGEVYKGCVNQSRFVSLLGAGLTAVPCLLLLALSRFPLSPPPTSPPPIYSPSPRAAMTNARNALLPSRSLTSRAQRTRSRTSSRRSRSSRSSTRLMSQSALLNGT